MTPQDLEHVSFAALQLNNEKRNGKNRSIVSAKVAQEAAPYRGVIALAGLDLLGNLYGPRFFDG